MSLKAMLWRLVVEILWPIIREKLKIYLRQFIDWLEAKIKDTVRNNSEAKQRAAESKAEEADRQAAAASSNEERARYEGRAEAFRETSELERDKLIDLFNQIEAVFVQARTKQDEAANDALLLAQEPVYKALSDNSVKKELEKA